MEFATGLFIFRAAERNAFNGNSAIANIGSCRWIRFRIKCAHVNLNLFNIICRLRSIFTAVRSLPSNSF